MLSVSWGAFCLCHGVRTGQCVSQSVGELPVCEDWAVCCQSVGELPICEDWAVCCQSVGELSVCVMV